MFWNIQEDDKGETTKEKQQQIIQVLNLKRVHTRYILDPTVREAAIKNIDTLYTRARRKNKKVIWVKKRKYGALTFVPFEKSLLSLPHKEYSLFLKPINEGGRWKWKFFDPRATQIHYGKVKVLIMRGSGEDDDDNENDKNEAALLKTGVS